jgi:hypothetical protein
MIKKIYLFFLLIVGVGISVIAGLFSISGLTTIFKGSYFSVLLMGSFLEVAKVSISIYLHLFWKDIRKLLAAYLLFALLILMAITSLGIYGYLSKSFFNSTDTSSMYTKVESMNISLELEKSKVKTARDEIEYLNNLPRDEKKSWHIYRIQKLSKDIDGYSTKLDSINEKYITEKVKLNSLESEVGPLKYLAMIIYNDKSQDSIAKSVQIFIIFIVLVFDPLAILIILSSINGYEIIKKEEEKSLIVQNKNKIIEEIKHIVKEEEEEEEEIIKEIEKEEIIEKNEHFFLKDENEIEDNEQVLQLYSSITDNKQEIEKEIINDFNKKRRYKKKKIENIIEEKTKDDIKNNSIEEYEQEIEFEMEEEKEDIIIEQKEELKIEEDKDEIDLDVFNTILEEVVESNKSEEDIDKMYKNIPMIKGRFQ